MLPIVIGSDGPIVAQVETQIKTLIESGRLAEGARIPSVRRLATDLGISTFTVVNAYDRLVGSSHIRARPNSGFYVAEQQLTHTPLPTAELPVSPEWLFTALQNAGNSIQAGAGVLPLDWFDEDALKRAGRTALRRSGSSFAQYPTPLGFRPLRELLAIKLIESGITVHEDQILLTSGASHAVDLVIRSLVSPEDTVLVEAPGYHSLYSYLEAEKIRFTAINRNPDGLDLDQLEETVRRVRPRLLIINSLLHNPTGYTLSPINAHKILGLADRYDFLILEDDIYGDFYGGRAFRLVNLDQLSRVIYVSSFSKTVSANLRTGFLAASATILSALAERKRVTCLATSEINERIMAELLASGDYRRQLTRIRQRLAAKQPRVLSRLSALGMLGASKTDGGFFVWARCPNLESSDALGRTALRNGLILAPGSLFSPTRQPSAWLRFNIATCDGVQFEDRFAATLANTSG